MSSRKGRRDRRVLQPRGTTEGTEWARNIDTELELARQFWELILGAPTPGGRRGLLAPTTARSRHGHLPNATLAQYKRFHRTYNLSSDRTRRPPSHIRRAKQACALLYGGLLSSLATKIPSAPLHSCNEQRERLTALVTIVRPTHT